MTSTEFDKFLAERAAAADNLPNITETGNGNNKTNNQPSAAAPTKPKKDEENLLAL